MGGHSSIDGYVDHTVGVGSGDELFAFFSAVLDETDVVVFGRVTYELMESAWSHARDDPKAGARSLEFAGKLNALAKVVFSRTLERASWTNTRIVRNDLASEVRRRS